MLLKLNQKNGELQGKLRKFLSCPSLMPFLQNRKIELGIASISGQLYKSKAGIMSLSLKKNTKLSRPTTYSLGITELV